jgi:hypothetical protein
MGERGRRKRQKKESVMEMPRMLEQTSLSKDERALNFLLLPFFRFTFTTLNVRHEKKHQAGIFTAPEVKRERDADLKTICGQTT